MNISRTMAAGFALLAGVLCAGLQAGTLEKIRSTNAATIGYTDVFPFSYVGADGKPRGYNIDLCTRILENLRDPASKEPLNLRFVKVTLSTRTIMVANGTVDLMCALMTENEAREQQVAFLPPTFVDNTKMIARADSSIRSLADMKGKRLVTLVGSSNVQIARALNKERSLEMTILPVKNTDEALGVLDEGSADAYLVSEIVLVSRAALAKKWPYRFLPESLEKRERAISLKSDDAAFRQAVDAALKKTVKTGEFERIYRRWFLSPIAPDGVTIGFPMDKSLAAWVQETKSH